MKRVARADHVWRPLTAQRFTCAGDLRRAGSSSLTLSGFQEYSRLARIWDHPDCASSDPPGMEAYSMVFEIKIHGRRIAGGVRELDRISDGRWAGSGFGFSLAWGSPPWGSFAAELLLNHMTVSICVVRKSDKKCLHLLTDIGVDDAEDDCISFDSLYVQSRCSSFNNVDGDYMDNATHDFQLYGADWDEERRIMRGFTDPYGELRLWEPGLPHGKLREEIILRRWHASKNWV
jgi:hypothetical protein